MRKLVVTFVAVGILCVASFGAEDKPVAETTQTLVLNDFETEVDLKKLEISDGTATLSAEGVTHGDKALQVTWDPKVGPVNVHVAKPPEDWTAYDALLLDVFNPGDTPAPASVAVCDKAWQGKPDYWTRHNCTTLFAPGKTTWTIPVRGMYRGETGYRNRDIKRDIDPDSIVRLFFGFGGKNVPGKLFIDHLRLAKVSAPKDVWAFGFGPASHAMMLGWTAVSNRSKYSAKAGFGFTAEIADSKARDTTFGPALIRSCVECGGVSFRVDVPEGKYSVMVIYENSGFWGGEQVQCSVRKIEVDGKILWKSEHPDGAAHALYRFENVEPVNVDVWDTYMAPELAAPVVFEAQAGKDGLTLALSSDHALGSRVSAIAIHKSGDETAAAWLKRQMRAVASEFRQMALCLDMPAPTVEAAAAWQKLGLVAWTADLDSDIKPASVPPAQIPDPDKMTEPRLAVRGEYEAFGIAIRPFKDLGVCKLRLEGGSKDIEAQLGVVWYGMTRKTGAISYHVVPQSLRPQSTVTLPRDITRQIVVTCHVADEAQAGDVNWTLVLSDAEGNDLLRVPLKLSVHSVKLDRQTDFIMGFYGLSAPSIVQPERRQALLEQSLLLLQQYGMNCICAAAACKLTGFENGQPQIDFAEMDAFVALAKKYGFTRMINSYGYGVLRGINDGYQIGATGRKVAQQAGVSYEDVLLRAWKTIDEHARKADWPTLYACLCDETRIRADFEHELEFMTVMSKASKAFPKTLRTEGAYSVHFNERPQGKDNMLYWRQRYFETLDASTLNQHDESVLAEAAKTGKEVYTYNQGQDRYSFGLYQWSEYRKGVKGHWQWALNDLYGYQFFDLDGWIDDEMMIFYGRNAIYPAVAFERCRQGAQDFYLYQMLWNLVEKGAGDEADRAQAKALLEDAVAKIKVNERHAPQDYGPNALKAKVIASIEQLTGKK